MTNANVEKERRKNEKKHCPVWRCELAFSLFCVENRPKKGIKHDLN